MTRDHLLKAKTTLSVQGMSLSLELEEKMVDYFKGEYDYIERPVAELELLLTTHIDSEKHDPKFSLYNQYEDVFKVRLPDHLENEVYELYKKAEEWALQYYTLSGESNTVEPE